MNKVKQLFLVLLLVMAQLPLCATNIELAWSFNQGDAKALKAQFRKKVCFRMPHHHWAAIWNS